MRVGVPCAYAPTASLWLARPAPAWKSLGGKCVRPCGPLRVGFFPHGETRAFGWASRGGSNIDHNRQIRLHNCDCLVGMSRVETGSVDLVLCDLPYGTTNCAWDTVIPFQPLWEHYRRVLKPRGALVLFAAQPFATDLINSARKLFRYDLVWEKNSPVGYANANRMPMRSHELMLVFYQRLPKYHPQGLIPLERPVVRRGERKGGVYRPMGKESVQRFTNYPRSVLRFPNRKERRFHPTQKPVALLEYLVRTYTDPGDLVLDNCMGSCSTAMACLNAGRRFVGFELDRDYFETARARVAEWTGSVT